MGLVFWGLLQPIQRGVGHGIGFEAMLTERPCRLAPRVVKTADVGSRTKSSQRINHYPTRLTASARR